ncbi:hypothetical protein PLUA15_220189 [Pseudomonas lundensis]|uniref:Uncharacterized protein n=1 Tax=Pseudomonas lundensis TaxID=86185 RepID=A0AAX2H779_9PSED|nr:hypothetical protein PLUA15_220189 [Pseudomonas lundensis]
MLTPMPQMMLISHKPKLAPATLSAATQPVPKKMRSAVPRNSAIHWPESVGCCDAVVMCKTSFLLFFDVVSQVAVELHTYREWLIPVFRVRVNRNIILADIFRIEKI